MLIVSVETMVIVMENKISSKMLSFAKLSRDLYDITIEKSAIECGITKQEADVLLFFANNPELNRACDAVVYRGFSKAYVSKALNSLLKRGFVEIKDDTFDKRYQRIVVKKKVNKVLSSLRKTQDDYFSILSEGISEEDFAIHIEVIEKIAENIINRLKG